MNIVQNKPNIRFSLITNTIQNNTTWLYPGLTQNNTADIERVQKSVLAIILGNDYNMI